MKKGGLRPPFFCVTPVRQPIFWRQRNRVRFLEQSRLHNRSDFQRNPSSFGPQGYNLHRVFEKWRLQNSVKSRPGYLIWTVIFTNLTRKFGGSPGLKAGSSIVTFNGRMPKVPSYLALVETLNLFEFRKVPDPSWPPIRLESLKVLWQQEDKI